MRNCHGLIDVTHNIDARNHSLKQNVSILTHSFRNVHSFG